MMSLDLLSPDNVQHYSLLSLHWSGSLHIFARKSFLFISTALSLLRGVRQGSSLGRYCSFCTQQTSLDSLKICKCIATSTRTTFRYVVTVHLPRLQTSNSRGGSRNLEIGRFSLIPPFLSPPSLPFHFPLTPLSPPSPFFPVPPFPSPP